MRIIGVSAAVLAFVLGAGCSTESKPVSETKAEPAAKDARPAVFKVDPATAGVISGKVSFTGRKPQPKRIDISEDEDCVRMNKGGLFDESVVVNGNGTLANVLIYIKSGLEGKTFERSAPPVTLDQRGCRFAPRLLAVQAGQPFEVTNSDPVTHNVHPVAQMNREWNQSQAPGDPPLHRRFARPEIAVRVKCNVHSWMRSWVAVVDHPYFGVTNREGNFTLSNVPPGDYVVEAWHEALGTSEQKVHIGNSQKATLAFQFSTGK